jgi:hypothetical protein
VQEDFKHIVQDGAKRIVWFRVWEQDKEQQHSQSLRYVGAAIAGFGALTGVLPAMGIRRQIQIMQGANPIVFANGRMPGTHGLDARIDPLQIFR